MLLAASMALPQNANKKAPETSGAGGQGREWPAYGGNAENTHYSPLSQINRSNVSKLQVAWTYDCSDGRGGLETNPLVADGMVFGNSPGGKFFALDGATGKLLWSWDSQSRSQRTRGFSYWADGPEKRLFFGYGRYVYAFDPKTGQLVFGFGSGGRIDLQQDLDRPPDQGSVILTTPGIVYKDLLIVGGRGGGKPARFLWRHPRLRRAHRESCAGRSTPSRGPASTATKPGRRTPGPTPARPTTGRAWRWT